MMPTFTNPGPDGWDIPLYGVTVAAGETVTLPDESVVVDAVGQATIVEAPVVEAPPAETPAVSPEGQ